MSDDRNDAGEAHGEPVGSLAEEAAALLNALSGAARDHLSGSPGAADSGADETSLGDALHRVNEHIATDAAECTWCPVCQVIHAVRSTSPEVKQHLAVAASSLVQAASGLLASHAPPHDRSGVPMEKIDLDDQEPTP
ncbi:MAG: hypothetical protein ACRDPH_06845 [Marmoricola sp.]